MTHCSLIFVLEMLYERRGWTNEGGKNPWSGKARALRTELAEIKTGKRALSPAADNATPQVEIISEDSRIVGDLGLLDV